jgi:Peptidase of plants and bacteria/Hemopexin/Protein of unknown function (DUF3421)
MPSNFLAWLLMLALSCCLPRVGVAAPMNWPCQGRCIDAAVLWRHGATLFFKSNQFWLYDINSNKVDDTRGSYPKAIPFPGFPQSWLRGYDTAFNGDDGKVYWLKGGEYIRLDVAGSKVDAGPLPIATRWPGLPPAWTAGINAAVNWGNSKLIFFKGQEALGYDLSKDTADAPRPIAAALPGLPEAWFGGIDAAINWGNGKAYIFKGHEYVRYDIVRQRVDGGYPRPIASDWPGLMRIVDWVNASTLQLPDGAVNVGHTADNKPLYLCAAKVGSAIFPGETGAPPDASCTYSDGQRQATTGVYAVAATKLSLAWTAAASAPSDKLIPTGISPEGRGYYLCRARFANGVHPGRIENPSGPCTITHDGRTYSATDNVEVASAPTIVNSPDIPLMVRLLSPVPGSDRFKDVCAADLSYIARGEAVGGRYPRGLPDMRTLMQTIARNVCAMLYKNPNEVPAPGNSSTDPWHYARTLEVVSQDKLSGASVSCDHSHCTLYIEPGWMFPKPEGDLVFLVTIIYHELTHAMHRPWCDGVPCFPEMGAFNEGLSDYISVIKAWKRPQEAVSQSGGDWKQGYQTTAYFMDWLDKRAPDFAYRFNMASRPHDSRWIPNTVRELAGKPIDVLWKEYETSIQNTMALPEAVLHRPSISKGIRVMSGTYGGNCEGYLNGNGTTDKTWHLKQACDGKDVCEYRVEWRAIGDPATGCAKDYVAVWQCPNGGSGTTRAEPEAGLGSKLVLSCNAKPTERSTPSR